MALGDLVTGLGIGTLFGLPGWFIVFVGVWKYRMAKRAKHSATTDLGSAPAGRVTVEGTARPIDEFESGTVTAPVTGTETLTYDLEVEVYMDISHDTSGWTDAHREQERAQFLLDGETGNAVVDPEYFEMLVDTETVVVEGRDEAPREVIEYVEALPDLTLEYELEGETYDRKVKFAEERIDPGTELMVAGRARQAPSEVPAGVDTATIVDDGDVSTAKKLLGQTMFVTDKPRAEAVEANSLKANQMFFIGGGWLLFTYVWGLIGVL